jgi:hypothetical protein
MKTSMYIFVSALALSSQLSAEAGEWLDEAARLDTAEAISATRQQILVQLDEDVKASVDSMNAVNHVPGRREFVPMAFLDHFSKWITD